MSRSRRWINAQPSMFLKITLGLLPFLVLLLVYQYQSDARKAENPKDKLLPSFSEMSAAVDRHAFQPSKRTGQYLLWRDTASSLTRLLSGIAIAALLGLTFGLATGAFPMFDALSTPVITAISLIPPMAILPILFIVFGLGELSKVVLIIIGISPFITREIYLRTKEIPAEQLIKAQTLGGNSSQVVFRVLLPQIAPRLIGAVRLSLGSAWLFLIAAEAIAATDGLGYRIFLVRRYLAMDVILPYVVWITFLAFVLDRLLILISQKSFPWYHDD